MARYYVEMDGYQYGPFDLGELRQLNASGVLAGTSRVREEHASDGEVLVQLLANSPSPQPNDGGAAPVEQAPPGQSEPDLPVQIQSPAENPVEAMQAETDVPAPVGHGGPSQLAAEASVTQAPDGRAFEAPAATVSWSERLAQLRGTASAPGPVSQPSPLSRSSADVVRQPTYAPEPARMQPPGTTAPEETGGRPAPELGRFVPEQPMPMYEPAVSVRTETPVPSVLPAGQGQPASVNVMPETPAVPTTVWQETGPAPQAAAEVFRDAAQGATAVPPKPAASSQAPPAAGPGETPAVQPAAGSWPPPAVFADLKLAPVGNDDPVEESASFSLPPLKYGIEETDLKTPSEWLEPPPPRPRPSMAFGDPDQDIEIREATLSVGEAPVPPAPAVLSAQPAAPSETTDGTGMVNEIAQPAPVPLSQGPQAPQNGPAAPVVPPASIAITPPVPTAPPAPAAPVGAVSQQPQQVHEEELTLSKEKLSRLDDIYGRSRPAPIVAQPETGAMRSSMQQQPPETPSGAIQGEGEETVEKKTNLLAGLVLIGAGAVSLLAGNEYLNLAAPCPGLIMALVIMAYGVLVLVGGLMTWLKVRWAAPIIRILALIPLGVLLACMYYYRNDLMALRFPVFLQKPLMYNAISLLATVLGPAIWPGRSKTARTA